MPAMPGCTILTRRFRIFRKKRTMTPAKSRAAATPINVFITSRMGDSDITGVGGGGGEGEGVGGGGDGDGGGGGGEGDGGGGGERKDS